MMIRPLVLLPALILMAAAPALAAKELPSEKWNADRAMHDIAAQLSFGTRAMNTPGHERTIRYIQNALAKLPGVKVETQQWSFKNTEGKQLSLTNIIARFHPENPERMIVGTHYDSIIRAYRDRENPDGPMPGANNSASGVAVLLETARVISESGKPPLGIDLVFFDGEEGPLSLGEGDPHWRPLGSPYFAQQIGSLYPQKNPQKAVVLDMVCYKDMVLTPEPYSINSLPKDVKAFWELGAQIAPSHFSTAAGNAISDDHSALIAAGIPSFLVIGFKYGPWFNTTKDTLDKCSAASLEGVGRTLTQYLYGQ